MIRILRLLSIAAVAASSLPSATAGIIPTLTAITIAGKAPGNEDGPVAIARFSAPTGIAADTNGNLFVSDNNNHTIRKVSPAGIVTTFAGRAGRSGDSDGFGAAAGFLNAWSIALDRDGSLFVADTANYLIRKIAPSGKVTTLAGTSGVSGSQDGPGTSASFSGPAGVAVDRAGNVYVADANLNLIRKIDPAGNVRTLAGLAGQAGTNDGPGALARFNFPTGVAVDAATNIFVADNVNNTIRKITPDGRVSTLAGAAGFAGGADGTGSEARFNAPRGLVCDATGNVYVADSYNHAVRKVTPAGAVTTFAGTGQADHRDGPGLEARFNTPAGIAIDGAGNLFVGEYDNNTVRKITPAGIVSTVVGQRTIGHVDGPANQARFNFPTGLAVDANGNVFVADIYNETIRRISPAGEVTTRAGVAGSYGSTDGPALQATFAYPYGLLATTNGTLYVADSDSHAIRVISPAGTVSTLTGNATNAGNLDGPLSIATFQQPTALAMEAGGALFVIDSTANTLRKISSASVRTLAGIPGVAGSADGIGAIATFNHPGGLAVSPDGTLFVSDTDNHTIRKVTRVGEVSTYAGAAGVLGSADGAVAQARFISPRGLALDSKTNLYVADSGNNVIRRISPAGLVTTISGRASYLTGSADGEGSEARFNYPYSIAVDASDTVYVTDSYNQTIRKLVSTASDRPVIDENPALIGVGRVLSFASFGATAWQWELIRWPTTSTNTFPPSSTATPSFQPDVADLFTFRLSATNSSGAIAIRTLEVNGVTFLPPAFDGNDVTVKFAGVAGLNYRLQVSTNLKQWSEVGQVMAAPNNGIAFKETGTAASPHRFYRTIRP